MKILIVSDTHGRHQALDRALEEAGKIDMFIHLGDVEGGEDYLEAVVECEKHIIRIFMLLPRSISLPAGFLLLEVLFLCGSIYFSAPVSSPLL